MKLTITAGQLVSEFEVTNERADPFIHEILYAHFVQNGDTSVVDGWSSQKKLDTYRDLLKAVSQEWAFGWRRDKAAVDAANAVDRGDSDFVEASAT